MQLLRCNAWWIALSASLLATGCGNGESSSLGSAGTSGVLGEGGARAAGGLASEGGTPASGGVLVSGGATSTGGTAASRGGTAPGTGGKATGGVAPSGGTTASGGAPTSTGGSTSAGGLPALHVDGTQIKDASGKTIVLRGVSLIDVGTLYYNASQNASGITQRIDKILAAGLVPRVIRMPVYPRTCVNSGSSFGSAVPFPVGTASSDNRVSLTADEYLSKVLKPAVDYATGKNLYVIIDYHQIDNTSGQSATDATTFWTFMAAKFASYSNVVYEPFNEPIDSTSSWSTLKPRVQAWIDTIRAAAPDNLLVVPSLSWDQKPGDATSSPPAGKNLVYAAHIYPGNWTTAFKQQVATAVTKAPLFITEWGYVLNGSDTNLGTRDTTWSTSLQTLVDGNGASWVAWVTDNSWTPNMFSSTALTTLTDFGTFTKNWLSAKSSSDWVQ